MKKLSRIFLGWYYWITNRNNWMAKERLQHCTNCEHRKWLTCGLCGCVLQAKARLREEECPANKWPDYFRMFYETLRDIQRLG